MDIRVIDEDLGLYWLKTRFYDPQTGRFISPDSVEYLDPETLGGINLYAYCNNNPVMNVDPNGTFALTLALIGLAIGAAVGAASSVVTQGLQNGWSNINAKKVLFDGLMGGVSGFIAASGIGAVGAAIAGTVTGAVGSIGGDLILNNGDFSKIDWKNAAVSAVIGGLSSAAFGAGAKNSQAIMQNVVGDGFGASKTISDGLVSMLKESGSVFAKKVATYQFFALAGGALSIISSAAGGYFMNKWGKK